MKKLTLIILLLITIGAKSQTTGSITVGGDFDKFYPTVWTDGGWTNRTVSELELGRSDVHENGNWRGSLIAKFIYHATRWGNGAFFIDADIMQSHNVMTVQDVDFIAGWKDATGNNATFDVVIWLRGGGTTYYYKSRYPTTCQVFDGVANPLPFQEVGGPALTFKTVKDSYVNSSGLTKYGTANFLGGGTNYIAGNVSIGTNDAKGYKLAVAGNMIAESVKVKLQGAWPDYVFTANHIFPTLEETEKHIKENGHLPGMPSAEEVKKKGLDLGEINAKLLEKIEEITLRMIELSKIAKQQQAAIKKQQTLISKQQIQINNLKKK